MKNTTNESQQQNEHVQEFLQTVLEKMGCGGCEVNLSETEDLVTLMWANEAFDPENPDTIPLEV